MNLKAARNNEVQHCGRKRIGNKYEQTGPLIWGPLSVRAYSLGHFWMVQKSGAEAEKGARNEWYCKIMGPNCAQLCGSSNRIFANEAECSACACQVRSVRIAPHIRSLKLDAKPPSQQSLLQH
jgi:hypothetical protein